MHSRQRSSSNSKKSSKVEEAEAKEQYLDAPLRSVDDTPPPYSRPSFSAEHQLAEDPLHLLAKYNTIVVLDDSGSMAGKLWEEAKNALANLGHWASQYDADGIDIYFLNAQVGRGYAKCNLRTAQAVTDAFKDVWPNGGTPLGARLQEILDGYIKECRPQKLKIPFQKQKQRPKPVNILVITDGCPTDDPKDVIIDAAREMDRLRMPKDQVGISFVQIGEDPSARAYLQELDDELPKYGIRDMVDTTPYSKSLASEPDMLVKILLGGVHRRVDAKGGHILVQRQRT